MPLYEFYCRDCSEKFEDLVNADEAERQICIRCASGDVVRVFSGFATGVGVSVAGDTDVGGCCGGSCGSCGRG